MSINERMIEYEENVNLVAKINTELCKQFGLEHYLTEFSSNLIRALNQYKRFVPLLEDKNNFVDIIIKFSNDCIEFFKKSIGKEPNATIKKMNNLIKDLNKINEMINNSYANIINEYLKDS